MPLNQQKKTKKTNKKFVVWLWLLVEGDENQLNALGKHHFTSESIQWSETRREEKKYNKEIGGDKVNDKRKSNFSSELLCFVLSIFNDKIIDWTIIETFFLLLSNRQSRPNDEEKMMKEIISE